MKQADKLGAEEHEASLIKELLERTKKKKHEKKKGNDHERKNR